MDIFDYDNFDILMERHGQGYRLHVIESPAGQAYADFELPFSREELRPFTWLSGSLLRHLRPHEEPGDLVTQLTPEIFGRRLFQAVLVGQTNVLLQDSLHEVERREIGLRIRLRFNDDASELASLPWEFLYDPVHKRFVFLSQRIVIARYLQLPQPIGRLRIKLPLHVLAVVSEPKNVPPLATEQEWSHLKDSLDHLQAIGQVKLERLEHPTVTALHERLLSDDVHILHFIGHGYFDSNAKVGGLVFEDRKRQPYNVVADQVGVLVRDHSPLQLVFLNACEGARSDAGDLFGGIAQRLVQQGIPAAIAMQSPVSDRAAIILSRRFYAALAAAFPVDAALAAARKELYIMGEVIHWGTPVLFSRSDDNKLIETVAAPPRLDFVHLPYEPQTVFVPAGSFFMGSELGDNAPPEETPQHPVYLPVYSIGVFPVTNNEYAQFIANQPEQRLPARTWLERRPPSGTESYPVVGVSWDDAVAYCSWLSARTGRKYRLPTEVSRAG